MSKSRENLIDTEINEYVMRPQLINIFKLGLKKYEMFLSGRTTRVYRYEDVIYRKYEWLKDMLAYLCLNLDSKAISKIAGKHDIHPHTEDPSKHVRQVRPGNFRRHLTEETIQKLNSELAEIIHKYGYDCINSLRLK